MGRSHFKLFQQNPLLKNDLTICRYAWMGAVVLAVLFFMAQVSQRMVVYFQYKTNVGVEVKYVDTITFPSVTICNQNNYRWVAFDPVPFSQIVWWQFYINLFQMKSKNERTSKKQPQCKLPNEGLSREFPVALSIMWPVLGTVYPNYAWQISNSLIIN